MDLSKTLAEISSLSVEDRIELIQAIWDSIDKDEGRSDLTDAQKQDLDRRLADLDASPNDVLTREQIKAKIQGGR